MGRYVIRRLIGIPPLLVGITLIVFAIVHLTPGGPLDDLRLNPEITQADIVAIETTLGLISRSSSNIPAGWANSRAAISASRSRRTGPSAR